MSVDDLTTVLDRLADFDYESNPTTKAELRNALGQLIAHYESEIFMTDDYNSNEGDTLPLTIGDMKSVYDHLVEQNGGLYVFQDLDEDKGASILDLNSLLIQLTQHFSLSKEPINISDSESLVKIFDKMADYYEFGAGRDKDKSADILYAIFDSLSEVFGSKSDYDMSDEEIQKLYENMQNNQEVQKRFEGTMIQDFEELVELAKQQKEKKIDQLFD